MSKAPALRESPDIPREIISAANDGQLVLFIGAGLSRLAELPSWSELASKVLEELRKEKFINYSDLEQLKTINDPRKKLTIADLIAKNNNYEINYKKHLEGKKKSEVYDYINKIGCPCVTTNYDELLYPSVKPESEKVAIEKTKRIYSANEFNTHHLNTPGTVVHLHGSVCDQSSMVVTTKDYLEHYDNKLVQHFLGELFSRKTVLFLGYGLEEAEILEHILRRGKARFSLERKRFALQGYFGTDTPLYSRLYDYYETSFGVHLVGFIKDFNNYSQLETVIKNWSSQIKVIDPGLVGDLEYMDEVLQDESS